MCYKNNCAIVSVQCVTNMHMLTMVVPHGILENVAFLRASQYLKSY